MKVQIRKWGNSLAVRIPKSFAGQSRITSGSTVDVSLEGEKIIVKAVAAPKYSLNQLLGKVKKSNLHREVDSGGPVGNEIW